MSAPSQKHEIGVGNQVSHFELHLGRAESIFAAGEDQGGAASVEMTKAGPAVRTSEKGLGLDLKRFLAKSLRHFGEQPS